MISVESVITLLLLLVHQSMLDKLSPDFNAGGINTTREHPHNDSSSYQNNSLTGNYRDELQVGRSPTSGDINSKAISSERKNITVEQSHDHLYFEEQNEKHIPELLSGILPNSSSENKLQVNNGTTSTGISKNQTVELELKPQKNLTNKKKCHFCNNDTKKDIQSSYQLFNNSEKSDQLDQLISSTVIPNKEPTINFSREDISLLPHVQTTTISGITVKDAEVVKTDAFNDNKIFHSQNVTVQPESHPKMRSNVSSNSSNQRFTSPSAGFRTSTMSVELSSILLQVNSDRETKKQKISLVPEADIPNFSNSNGK